VTRDYAQIGSGDFLRFAAPLLPVLQGSQIEVKHSGKLRLAHAHSLSSLNKLPRAKHPGKLTLTERLRVGIVERGRLDFVVGQTIESVPVCPARRFRITGSVTNKLLFHVGWPSGR